MILYAWVSYLREDWTWKNCILLAVGMAVCALSYYNAYGWILCSFFFFCFTVLLCREEAFSQRVRFLFSRGAVIAAVTLVLCGWWFIRNAVCITEISWEGNPVRNVRKNMLRRITDLHCIRRLQSWDGTGKILSFIRIPAGIITGF